MGYFRKAVESFHEGEGSGHLLHGMLHVRIIQCKGLRNFDRLGVRELLRTGKQDKSDPYVTAWIGDYRLLKTKHINSDLDPVFNEEFYCNVAHFTTKGIEFKVKDFDNTSMDDTLGKYLSPINELYKEVDDSDIQQDSTLSKGDLKRVGVHKVVYLDGKRNHGSLEFFIEFIPVRMLCKSMEVPGVYFTATQGNSVKLYMNADDDGSAPVVKYGGENDDDEVWTPPRLWRDIYDAFCNAQHFIYVAGWSVDTDQFLLRGQELEDAQNNGKMTAQIGPLLVAKADEGVIVNLMQWDDYSSNVVIPGMMSTFDEKSRHFFHGTKVSAEFMSMIGGEGNTMLQGQSKKMAFTHHQKFIIVDAPKENGEGRELVAFVGGIDLTLGRWDNRQHPLFRSLQSTHKGDAYGKCFTQTHVSECGPRQPWHDIHSAVRGPAAIHLATAFDERWTKQADAGKLINRARLGLDSDIALANDGGWCCQINRSIDSRVNNFDPSVNQRMKREFVSHESKTDGLWQTVKQENILSSRRYETASISDLSYNRCLDQKKGRLVDNSIEMSNVYHIRRAEHFIYIESQYFMGSSFMWSKDEDCKCGNLIAAEIALKICEKIAANEPFSVYILLPMWMEGITEAKPTQSLLYYQRLTIEAMYKVIQTAIEVKMTNSSAYGMNVTDFLNIYCLGTRETAKHNEAVVTPVSPDEKLLTKTRRHQIYVHSKMMIVDDAVALIGTANINQRSMDGCRDSEIMMTSWQFDHLATETSTPKGDIYAYRMHIWASLTGQFDEAFRNPQSPECVKVMNKIADDNWKNYMGNETVDMDSYLLPFPLEFDGMEVRPRTGLVGGNLPDTNGSVLGKKSMILPEIFLT